MKKIPLAVQVALVLWVSLLALAFISFRTIRNEFRPGVRLGVEDTLVESSNLLAEMLSDGMQDKGALGSEVSTLVERLMQRRFQAKVYTVHKTQSDWHIYITDAKGWTVYDSQDVNGKPKDYSRWNDVYLTLRGKYGARSTRKDPTDPSTSVMHVAAPIRRDGQIVGVVSIGKSASSLQPYVALMEKRIVQLAIVIFMITSAIAFFAGWLLNRNIKKLVHHAETVALNEKRESPHFSTSEFQKLSDAITLMQKKLDGTQYVESYVQSLTHEMKSPLTAMRAAGEILHDPLPIHEQRKFSTLVSTEAVRMGHIVDQMLSLSRLETFRELGDVTEIPLKPFLQEIMQRFAGDAHQKNLEWKLECDASHEIRGNAYWLGQAVSNLISNAVSFADQDSTLFIRATYADLHCIEVENTGPMIEGFAVDKIYDKFFSLPRPGGQERSTGLGLTLVKQIAELHHGSVVVENVSAGAKGAGGVRARLLLGQFK